MRKIRNYTERIESFLQSDSGQRFFNVAYSVGAAIVLWGALFQILHIRGGATLLCVGMGTEIFMFILSAFDRPPKDPDWDNIISKVNISKSGEYVSSLTIEDDSQSTIETDKNITKFKESVELVCDRLNELQILMEKGNNGYAQQIAELNKNIAGLNSIYDLQLRNITGQLATIDNLNKDLKEISDSYKKSASNSDKYYLETEKMTEYLHQINEIYAGMLVAMKGK